MKIKMLVLTASMLAMAGTAAAHGDHDHEHAKGLSEDAVKARASEEVARLVSIKKIDAAWKDVAVKGVEKKGTEWLVTFENAKAKEKKTLYVFLKASGDFVAANFTGR